MSAILETESPKRQAVLDAAATLFMAHGYGDVSMDAIAREASVSKATLYAHCGSKVQLFATIINETCRSKMVAADVLVETEIASTSDVGEALRAFGIRVTQFLLEPTTQAIYRVVVAECVRFPELAQSFYDSGPAHFRAFFSGWIGRQMRAGRLREGDPTVAAEQFVALVRGDIHLRISIGLSVPHDAAAIERHVGDAVDTFLRAFGTG